MAALQRLSLLAVAALSVAVLAGCGGSAAAPTAARSSDGPSSASVAPVATPSGPITATAGESAASFWSRRGVTPAPPATFLDAYATLPLPAAKGTVAGSAALVRAALRELSGETYATDHLRLDLVDAGVLGAVGLAGDDTSITTAQNAGLTVVRTSLVAVQEAAVVRLPAAQAKSLDADIVVLRLRYGPTVGTYADGTSHTLPATAPVTQAVAGHLVSSPLLGTYLYVTSAADCATAVKGSATAAACAVLS